MGIWNRIWKKASQCRKQEGVGEQDVEEMKLQTHPSEPMSSELAVELEAGRIKTHTHIHTFIQFKQLPASFFYSPRVSVSV